MWWPKMVTAGQYGAGYTVVPPTVVEQGNSTGDIADENRYVPHQYPSGWGYEHGYGAGASTQATSYAPGGQLQQQRHLDNGEYNEYNTAEGTPNRTPQWDYQSHQNQVYGVSVPQAAYYTPEGWAYHGGGAQYWNHQYAAEQPMNDTSSGSAAVQYGVGQQYDPSTVHIRGQQEGTRAQFKSQNALPEPSTNTPHGHADGWQHRHALIDPVISEPHPRENLSVWKWRLMLVASNILSLINGYDVSNIANIQAPIYEAFTDVRLLPWLALSYSVCNVVATPLARKLYKFYDIKVLTLSGLVLLIAGNTLAAAAPSFLLLIVGRAIMAFGASIVYQGILSFSIIFSYPSEISLVYASFGASYSFGILTGPVIGAGFAQNEHATWRWSFYFSLPILVIALLLCIFNLPSYSASTEKSVSTHFKQIDWAGHILHSGTFITFGLATVFSGSAWPWGSVPQLAIWVIFVTVAVAYIAQQTFSIGIRPNRRILPIHLLKKRTVLLSFLCTLGASITYGVTLYYMPLFYEFTHKMEPLEAGLRLLSFTALFITTIFISHAILPTVRYYMPLFVFGGALLLAGGISFHTVTSHTSLAIVMVFSALLGAGVGILWNLAIPVCSAVLETQEDRLDQTTLHSIAQLGGTAFSLSVSAIVYRNIGPRLVKEAVGLTGFADADILNLLSGAESALLESFSAEVRDLVINAIVATINQVFYIVIAGAALSFIASIFLRFEPLQFKRWIRTKDCEDDAEASQKGKKVVYELR
ncbi:major facilitator superfamily domain-containing protein [Nemania sp. FL0916]|nr:major facilitator superfamily domain-containing protein [Nemania sp. FL0916]